MHSGNTPLANLKSALQAARGYLGMLQARLRTGGSPLHQMLTPELMLLQNDQNWSDRGYPPLLEALRSSVFFDPEWYRSSAARSGADLSDPLTHYLHHGSAESLSPSKYLDPQWYLDQNPDVRSANIDPLIHFVVFGCAERRPAHPVLARQPLQVGFSELATIRESGVFDEAWYAATYRDVPGQPFTPLEHYATRGAREGRDPNPFFDTIWYLRNNPDVAAAGMNPVVHYVLYGASEGRDPGPKFDTIWYSERYPDVAQSRVNPLIHYLKVGRGEMREIMAASENPYQKWISHRAIDAAEVGRQLASIDAMTHRPVFSILVPTYKSDIHFLDLAIKSVIRQTYPNWQLCIVDDGSKSADLSSFLKSWEARDHRIKVSLETQNRGIAGATNIGLSVAEGEFIVLLDHDDEVAAHALYAMADAINRYPDADMLYSDEDKISPEGTRFDPFFKPDWSPEFMLSCMYTCHLSAYRKSLVEELGGFRSEFDFAQDYDLALRISAKARRVVHIPDILYHWRVLETSTASGADAKPTAELAARRALQSAIESEGLSGQVIQGPFRGSHRIKPDILHQPLISIVIPTAARRIKDSEERWYLLDLLISVKRSTYQNFEVILVHNGDIEKKLADKLSNTELNIIYAEYSAAEFNIAEKMNQGVDAANGDLVLLLNDDMTVISAEWLEEMLMWFQRSGVVGVGAKLLFPDDKVQHAGVLLLAQGPSHVYYGASREDKGLAGSAVLVRNYSAVTGACMMVRKADYLAVGGFDRDFRVNYNDVDFCLKLNQLGRIVYTPYALLYHYESVSKDIPPADELDRFKARWSEITGCDPFYNHHLSQSSESNSLSRRIRSLSDDYPSWSEGQSNRQVS